ncbi:unnamed protein product [Caenorhabditis sp. 36 PRJEB53466]|nr:unnamed protein product [Caenorhabditis sp. 36 PRJEB53466]
MAFILPFLIALLLILFVTFKNKIRLILKYAKSARTLPGPPIHPIFGNAAFFQGKTNDEVLETFVETANKLREQGETVMRIVMMSRMYVYPLDGKTVQKLLESTTELDKGDDYGFPAAWLGRSVLLDGYGERWRTHRKLLTPTFHFAKLEGYLKVFNNESQILVDHLGKFADSGETVDVFPFIKHCTLDTICETAMGTKVDAQSNPEHPYVKAVEGFNKMSVAHAINPHLQFDFIYWILGYQKMKDAYVNTMKTFTGNVLAERRAAIASGEVEKETSKRNMNFLDILLASKESNTLSEEDIRAEVDTFIFAGHDTTTISFSWMLWNLAHNPEVQEKVYEELIAVFGEDPNADVSSEDIRKLDYTERVLKESKRMMTPIPSVQRKLREDMEIGGHLIPSEVNVCIAPAIYHSNPKVFTSPEKFDPDRFLPENISKRNTYDYIPFSAGLRNCIGQKFSQLNEKVMLIHVLKNFKIEPKLPFYGTKPSYEIVAKPSNGIPVKLTRR